jgi:hypothetical protein
MESLSLVEREILLVKPELQVQVSERGPWFDPNGHRGSLLLQMD